MTTPTRENRARRGPRVIGKPAYPTAEIRTNLHIVFSHLLCVEGLALVGYAALNSSLLSRLSVIEFWLIFRISE